jgi:hypothetical protein
MAEEWIRIARAVTRRMQERVNLDTETRAPMEASAEHGWMTNVRDQPQNSSRFSRRFP